MVAHVEGKKSGANTATGAQRRSAAIPWPVPVHDARASPRYPWTAALANWRKKN